MEAVARGAVAALPQGLRRRAEALLAADGLARLAGVMVAWSRGAGQDRAAFAARFLGRDGDDPVAVKLETAVRRAGTARTHLDLGDGARALADAMQAVGLDRWPRFLADAEERARAAGPDQDDKTGTPNLTTPENVEDLARVIEAEAGGVDNPAPSAVGWTVRNRMLRNGTTSVRDVWRGFAHGKSRPADDFVRIARSVLDGTPPDPTGGATHFYTPQQMPKKGDSTSGTDVGGGLESVPDVKRNGKPIESYRPSWANDPRFEAKPVPGVPESVFKFYRQKGGSHVR